MPSGSVSFGVTAPGAEDDRRRPVASLRLVLTSAIAVFSLLVAGGAPAQSNGAFASGQLAIQGTRLSIAAGDESQVLDVAESARVRTCFAGVCGSMAPGDPRVNGLLVKAELSGPELQAPATYTATPGGAFLLPGVQTEGTYLLSNIRLVREAVPAGATEEVLGQSTPAVVTLEVRRILATTAKVRQLTLAELQARGIQITQQNYDAYSRISSETTGSGGRRRLYDERGRLVYTTDGHEGYWRGLYDDFGGLTEERIATGAVTRRCFNAEGRPTREEVRQADGKALSDVSREYTSFGAVSTLVERLSSGSPTLEQRVTRMSYDRSGRLLTVKTGDGDTLVRDETTLAYDSANRTVRRTDAAGNKVDTVFEPASRLFPSSVRLTEFGRSPYSTDFLLTDAAGNVLFQRGSDGSTVLRAYDEAGRVTCEVSGANPPATYSWDGAGRLLASTLPAGGQTTYRYDLDGRVTSETVTSSAGSWITSHGYDVAHSGRLTGVTFPDGTAEAYTQFDPDDVPRQWTNRHGQVVSSVVDTANRLRGLTPSGGPANLATYSLSWDYDDLSRLTRAEKTGVPASAVVNSYDLGGRPETTTLGIGASFTRDHDVWDQPFRSAITSELSGDAAAGLPVLRRDHDALSRATRSSLDQDGGPDGSGIPGARLTWSGTSNLELIATLGPRSFQQTRSYDSPGRASSFGFVGSRAWGDVGVAYRPEDSYKTGRIAPSAGLFSGQGWTFTPDTRLRLTSAECSRETFRLSYGAGDELLGHTRDKQSLLASFSPGPGGRLLSRNGDAFVYNASGDRTEDERFVYGWSWRGELVSLEVKGSWPADGPGEEPRVSPWAGHKLYFDYDALGRLTARTHLGVLPSPAAPDTSRPFISRREVLWDGGTLLAEVEKDAQGAIRWRKTLVPGATGLDDAVQMRVEDYGAGNTPARRLYSFVRDEQGTVLGLVDEQAPDPARGPPLPARYLYTPLGEAHAETGPELLRARFDATRTSLNGTSQNPPRPDETVGGAVLFDVSLTLDPETLGQGVPIETWSPADNAWQRVPAGTFLLALDQDRPTSISVLPLDGWPKETRFRIRLTSDLLDDLERPFRAPDGGASFDVVLEIPADGRTHPVYDRTIPTTYDTARAASDTVGGRVPGGMNLLHAGAWTDPVSGLQYLRARWYDPRTGNWLSEDPMGDVDSPNRYAYVGWRPNEATDPTGEIAIVDNAIGGVASVAIGFGLSCVLNDCNYSWADAGVDFGLGFATSGLSNLGKLRHLGKVGRWAMRTGAEAGLDIGSEVVRRELKGEDYTFGDLAVGAGINAVIGEGGAYAARHWRGAFRQVSSLRVGFRSVAASLPLGPFQSVRLYRQLDLRNVDPRYIADPRLAGC